VVRAVRGLTVLHRFLGLYSHWRTVPGSGRTADSIGTGCRMADGPHPTTVDEAVAPQPGEPGGMKQLLSRWLNWAIGTIDLDNEPPPRDLINAWIAVAAAVVVGAVLGLQDWQSVRDKPQFARYLFVDAVAAFVLTPLFVSAQLGLREVATSLLRRLDQDEVIRAGEDKETPSDFGKKLNDRLDHPLVVRGTALLTAGYLTYELLEERNEMTSPSATVLIAITLVVSVALFYLAVLTIIQISIACRRIGKFLYKCKVNVQPLHPDRCGGLRPVGHMLDLVLTAAAILGGAGLCIFLAVQDTPSGPTRRPESYVLAIFYFALLPRAFYNLLWVPHLRMKERQKEVLIPVIREFRHAVSPTSPSATEDIIPLGPDNARRLKAKADSLSAITSQSKEIANAYPVWPLPTRPLQGLIATAILPVAIPVVTAIISSFLTRAP
jgi:hypothetical protein